MLHQPFRDELAIRRRTALVLFYLSAVLSLIAISFVGRVLSFRTPLLVLAVAGAAVAILFLWRFLRSNDEHERQINYRALTFAFIGTLVFSAVSSRASVFTPSRGLAFPPSWSFCGAFD